MNKIKIQVKEKHIKDGIPENCTYCAVALAIDETLRNMFKLEAEISTPVAYVNHLVTDAVIAIYATSVRILSPSWIASKETCLKLGLPAVTFISTCAPYPRVRPVPKRRRASSVPLAV